MAVNGWRNLVTEDYFDKLQKLAKDDGQMAVVSIEWQGVLLAVRGQERRLRDVLGTLFAISEIGGEPVHPVPEKDLPRLFRETIRWMDGTGFLLWLDYGHRDAVPGFDPQIGGAIRIEDLRHYYEFRALQRDARLK